MNPSALFIINSDPRTSPLPAEAVRIAAGVGTWKKVDVTVCLCEASVLALGEFVDGLTDEDNFTLYLPLVGEFGRPIYVETGAPFLKDLGQSPVKFERISVSKLAEMAANSTCVLRF